MAKRTPRITIKGKYRGNKHENHVLDFKTMERTREKAFNRLSTKKQMDEDERICKAKATV